MREITIDSAVFNSRANIDTLKTKAEQSGLALLDFAQKLAGAANHSTTAPYAQFAVNKIGLDENAPTKGIVDFAILHALMDKTEAAPATPETATGQTPANDITEAQAETPVSSAADNDNVPAESGAATAMLFKESAPHSHPKSQPAIARGKQDISGDGGRAEQSIRMVDTNILDFSFAVTKNPHHIMTAACMLRTDTALKQADGAPIYARSGKMGDVQDADNTLQIANFIFAWVHDNIPEKDQPKFRENCQKLGLVGGEPSIGFTAQIA